MALEPTILDPAPEGRRLHANIVASLDKMQKQVSLVIDDSKKQVSGYIDEHRQRMDRWQEAHNLINFPPTHHTTNNHNPSQTPPMQAPYLDTHLLTFDHSTPFDSSATTFDPTLSPTYTTDPSCWPALSSNCSTTSSSPFRPAAGILHGLPITVSPRELLSSTELYPPPESFFFNNNNNNNDNDNDNDMTVFTFNDSDTPLDAATYSQPPAPPRRSSLRATPSSRPAGQGLSYPPSGGRRQLPTGGPGTTVISRGPLAGSLSSSSSSSRSQGPYPNRATSSCTAATAPRGAKPSSGSSTARARRSTATIAPAPPALAHPSPVQPATYILAGTSPTTKPHRRTTPSTIHSPQPTTNLPYPFPPGQQAPHFIPIGRPGVASAAQGNTWPIERDLFEALVGAERGSHGGRKLAYKEILAKYNRWDVKESTLRGVKRKITLPKEHRERVPRWGEEHVNSLFRHVPLHMDAKGKVSWAKVVAAIKRDTGRPFGAGTTSKKWADLTSSSSSSSSKAAAAWKKTSGAAAAAGQAQQQSQSGGEEGDVEEGGSSPAVSDVLDVSEEDLPSHDYGFGGMRSGAFFTG